MGREEKKTVSFNLKDTDSDPIDNHHESTMNDNDNSTDGDLKSDNDIVESEKEKEEKVPLQKGEPLTSNNVSVKAAAAAEVDPRDIEIQVLRAKLEQTEKTLERVLAQMAGINMPNLRQQPKKKKPKKPSTKRSTDDPQEEGDAQHEE